MITGIDWLGFTLPIASDATSIGEGAQIAYSYISTLDPELAKFIMDGQQFDPCQTRAPYRYGFAREDHGVFVYCGSNTGTLLVELTGRVMSTVRDFETVQRMIGAVRLRVTRIDVSIDMLTDARPFDFAQRRTGKRSTGRGHLVSSSGETFYIGSMSSDRYCRCYRYEPPHPRSHLLRAEVVHRRRMAKGLAEAFTTATGWGSLEAYVGEIYQFQHPAWRIGMDDGLTVSTVRPEVGNGQRVAWLYKQVAPAIKKAVEEGTLDWDEFVGFIFNKPTM